MKIPLSPIGAVVSIMALLGTTVTLGPEEAQSQIQIQGSPGQRIELVIQDRTFFLGKGGPFSWGHPSRSSCRTVTLSAMGLPPRVS